MIKLKVGNVIYFRGTPEWLWKVLSVFDRDSYGTSGTIQAIGTNHDCYTAGETLKWHIKHGTFKVVPRLKEELLK